MSLIKKYEYNVLTEMLKILSDEALYQKAIDDSGVNHDRRWMNFAEKVGKTHFSEDARKALFAVPFAAVANVNERVFAEDIKEDPRVKIASQFSENLSVFLKPTVPFSDDNFIEDWHQGIKKRAIELGQEIKPPSNFFNLSDTDIRVGGGLSVLALVAFAGGAIAVSKMHNGM